MKKLYFFAASLFAVLLITSQAQSQNLVPDPGFENYDGTSGNYFGPLYDWDDVNGTPDHHHIDNPAGSNLTSLDTTCAVGQGMNQCGYPYAGDGVGGFYKANGVGGTKEWGGCELTSPLLPNNCYAVTFYINNKKDKPEFIMETSNWGVFFSHTEEPDFDPNATDFAAYSNQWVTHTEMITGSEWHKVELVYFSDSNYPYMYLGYMGNVADATTNAWSESGSVGFYVWIDEVSVELIETANVTSSAGSPICQGDSTMLSLNANYPIEWANGLGNSQDIWVSPTETTTYDYIVAPGSECAQNGGITIEVEVCSNITELDGPNGVIESIYPNPASESVAIQLSSAQNGMVEIVDLRGRRVLKERIINQTLNLDISSLEKGVYVVRVMEENKVIGMQSLIIE